MRPSFAGALLALAGALWSQQAADSPGLEQARRDAERIRRLVEAGALPRKALEQAQLVLEEARDEEVLRRTLYGRLKLQELTPERVEEMLAAARSLVERQQRELEKAESLVRVGALPEDRLEPYREELAKRRETLALAEKRAGLFRELLEAARREEELDRALRQTPEQAAAIAERFEGSGVLLRSQIHVLELEFERKWGRPLPVSARGETAVHRALGFDHRGRLDVALHPDSREGAWLRALLEQMNIPYFAFRGRVPGSSTAAHIHIGPPSVRLKKTD